MRDLRTVHKFPLCFPGNFRYLSLALQTHKTCLYIHAFYTFTHSHDTHSQVPPSPLSEPHLHKLQRLCPSLTDPSFNSFCCTGQQVDYLTHILSTEPGDDDEAPPPFLSFFKPCPACTHNIRHLFCALTCSPDHAAFLNVTATAPTEQNTTAALQLDVSLARRKFARPPYRPPAPSSSPTSLLLSSPLTLSLSLYSIRRQSLRIVQGGG